MNDYSSLTYNYLLKSLGTVLPIFLLYCFSCSTCLILLWTRNILSILVDVYSDWSLWCTYLHAPPLDWFLFIIFQCFTKHFPPFICLTFYFSFLVESCWLVQAQALLCTFVFFFSFLSVLSLFSISILSSRGSWPRWVWFSFFASNFWGRCLPRDKD